MPATGPQGRRNRGTEEADDMPLAGWTRYVRWLPMHRPADTVGPLPRLGPGGDTSVPGLFVAGELAGATSLQEARDSGADMADRIAADPDLRSSPAPVDALDLAVVGGGVAGFAAALGARRAGLSCVIVQAHEPFADVPGHAPRRTDVSPAPDEALLADLRAQAESARIVPRIARAERIERTDGLLRVVLAGGGTLTARRVVVTIGRGGCPGRLGIPGEQLDHVFHRLYDPADFAGQRVVVVGGGQTAAEAAIALAESGAEVTLVHRGAMLTRPRFRTLSRLSELLAGAPTEPFRKGQPRSAVPRRAPGPGTVTLQLVTRLVEVRPGEAVLDPAEGPPKAVPAGAVVILVGSDPARAFLERSGVALRD
jgi:NosR/NirI family transcriptional regulator, nitrous oxide reductase regulator